MNLKNKFSINKINRNAFISTFVVGILITFTFIIVICYPINSNKSKASNNDTEESINTVENADSKENFASDNEVVVVTSTPWPVYTIKPAVTEPPLSSTNTPAIMPTIAPTAKVTTKTPQKQTTKPTQNPTPIKTKTPVAPRYNFELPSLVYIRNYTEDEKNNLINSTIVDTSNQLYSYDNMIEDINILYNIYTDYVEVVNRGLTADGRYLAEIIIGNKQADKHILIHAGTHGREYITSLLVMKQLEFYLKNYETKSYNGYTYKELLEEVAVHIVPMVNPDGITISQYGISKINSQSIKNNLYKYYKRDYAAKKIYTDYEGYLKIWKSNGTGTDINKNFNHNWDSYEGPTSPSRLNYKGTAPESEPETQALVSIVNDYNFVASIAYHATGSVIYWDYGQRGTLRTECYNLVKAIGELTGYQDYSAKEVKMNPAGYSDWMVINNSIPAITVEIGKEAAPVPINEFSNIWSENKMVWAKLCYMYK